MFDQGILGRNVFDAVYAAIRELLPYAPKDKYLVHGDFHFWNMLSDGSTVTGIVDWETAMYGDFMFDVAVLHLWHPQARFPERVREAWEAEGDAIPRFDERLLRYRLIKGLDGWVRMQGNTTCPAGDWNPRSRWNKR
ncbi:aminoglycoside phosphotransferase family protein [Paenibacillus sp.]|uniref:aminoglycoside phosphotransferase family protein n=1 Tax=Paenibacillus sp. TaxID=58172 RepID=UPI0028119408|nr:aminoglycoside phosphotransferase family protein [Paenibacillus sp.]